MILQSRAFVNATKRLKMQRRYNPRRRGVEAMELVYARGVLSSSLSVVAVVGGEGKGIQGSKRGFL